MGCDIHLYAERKNGDVWEQVDGDFFCDFRSYGVFGLWADVRNYSQVTPIAPRRGLPEDISGDVLAAHDDDYDFHSETWLSVTELASFNYDAMTEDRRVTRQVGPRAWDGACTAEPGGGKAMTFREFLGEWYFAELAKLKASGAERIVFWFDN